MARYSMTFNSFCKKLGIDENTAQTLIAVAQDQVDFCSIISKSYKQELTLKQVADIYETAPTDPLNT